MSTVDALAGMVPIVVAGGIVNEFAGQAFKPKATKKRKVNKSKKRAKKVKRSKSSSSTMVLGIKI